MFSKSIIFFWCLQEMNKKYNKILTRRSIRKFRIDGITPEYIRDLEGFISQISSYRSGIHFNYEIREFRNDTQIQKAVGIYGKIMFPVFVLIPSLKSEKGDFEIAVSKIIEE